MEQKKTRAAVMGKVRAPLTARVVKAWEQLSMVVHFGPINSESEYRKSLAQFESLYEGDDKRLDALIDVLAKRIEDYEERRYPIPEASPREVVRFLMDQHGLKQSDLSECIAQSNLSAFLAGRRALPIASAKKLAQRFHVPLEVLV